MPEAFAEFHFLRPWWLLLLVAVPMVVWLEMRYAMRANNWHKVIAPALFDALIDGSSSPRKRIIMALPPFVLLCAALALAGPTYQRIPQPVETKNDPIVIVLDLTLSMSSTDIHPSRVERAKFKIADVLKRREEGQTALVVYAGDAYVVTPLTTDDSNILNLLPSLSPDMMPVKGSNASAALTLANDLIDSIGHDQGRILLLTDGIGEFAELRRAIEGRHPISILGVGSPDGGESSGRSANLDESLLRDFARVTGGRYRTIDRSDSDIAFLLEETTLVATDLMADQTFDAWHDLGYFLIIPLACFLALLMRRGGLAVALIFVGTHVQGGWLQDLWIPKDRQAHAQHEQGNFTIAAEMFQDAQWRGVAKYRSGEFSEANELFEQDESLSSSYNRGNARAWEGRLSEAIAAYDEVLAQDPDHEDAKHNKAILEELLQSMQNQQQSGESEQSEQEDQEGEQQQSQQQNAGEQQQESSRSEQSNQDQQQNEMAESQEDEQQQEEAQRQQQQQERSESQERSEQQEMAATDESSEERELREIHERWLRRIPEDPSGLLQRKFQAESNARIERGELNQNDVGSAW